MLTVFGCNAAEPPKFGVVDVTKVVQSAKASQKANAEIEALVKTKQVELNQKGEALKKMEKSLKEPGSKIKPEEYTKLAAEYQKLGAAAEADVKKKATELRKAVFEQIKKVIEVIGQEEKFVMIFIADNVPYYQPTTDVTDKVIKKYDESAGVSSKTEPPADKTAPPPSK
jgi:Skp family chaperone for outer membrane proteins